MNKNERDKIVSKVSERFAYNGVMSHYPSEMIVDFILSLIDSQRCVWTRKSTSPGIIVYQTSCDKQAITSTQKDFNVSPFCQACGFKIEVKDGR